MMPELDIITVEPESIYAGATEEFADLLHDIRADLERDAEERRLIGYRDRQRQAVAVKYGLDLTKPAEVEIADEVLALRLNIGERLGHFRGRWEREVRARWSYVPARPNPAQRAVQRAREVMESVHSFAEVRAAAGILALPSAE